MKIPLQPSQRLTRRAWLLLTTTALSGCGGGGGGGGGGISVAGSPGTGGTGSPIFSQGSIAGFGSVIVNGVKFDDLHASVEIDGVAAASADLRLGMVADVVGSVGADPALGAASSIGVWSAAQGAVSQVTAAGFMVAGSDKTGMSIQTDAATVFEGVASSAELVGHTVTVWGLQTSANARVWTATRVELAPVTVPFVNSGLISVSNKQVYLNGLLLNGILAASLSGGNLVRVQGTLSTDGKSVTVTGAKLLGTLAVAPQQSDVEIEGYVSSLTPPNGFAMNGLSVDTRSAATSPVGAAITVGARVEVYGTLSGTVLIARLVKLEDENSPSQTEISGTITTYTSVSDFVLRGQRCDATSAVFSHGSAADLKVGAKVQLKGINEGDVLKVNSLEFDN